MRKSFNGLSGLVKNELGRELTSGDVFIFRNRARAARPSFTRRPTQALVPLLAVLVFAGRNKTVLATLGVLVKGKTIFQRGIFFFRRLYPLLSKVFWFSNLLILCSKTSKGFKSTSISIQ